MAKANYRVTVRSDQVNGEGRSAVRIRITKGRDVRYFQTGIFLKVDKDPRKSEWNPKGTAEKQNWVTGKHRDQAQLNTLIKRDYDGLREKESLTPALSPAGIRDAYTRPEQGRQTGFVAFAEEWIARKRGMGQYASAGAYVTVLGYFRRFWGSRPDDPARLTPSIIGEFVKFLRTCDTRKGKGTGYDPKTINDSFAVYRSFFRHGVLEGWIPPMQNPFDLPPLPEGAKDIARPGVDQLLGLMHLEGLTRAETDARNIFLMQFFLNGARISEVYTLRWSDVGKTHVAFRPKKRARHSKQVPRHEGIEWVLSQYPRHGVYIFPYFAPEIEKADGVERQRLLRNINTRVANSLKRVAQKAGFAHLSSHMQRHTFADHVWEATGDIRQVQELIGHASSKTTEVYLSRLGQQGKDNLNETLYAGVGLSQGNVRETKTAGAVGEHPPTQRET